MRKNWPASRLAPLFLSLFVGSTLLCGGVAFGQAAAAAPGTGAPEATLTDVLKTAFDAFNGGDFQTAATQLENVLSQAADSPQLEPVYYMLGSAYFNLQNYPKAIEVFKKYQEKFPTAERGTNVAFSMGEAYLQMKKYPEAAEVFTALEKASPKFREESQLYSANALKEQGKIDDAIAMLEKLVAGGIKSHIAAKAALMLAPFYGDKDETAKAVALVTELAANLGQVENIIQFNAVTIKLGDKFLDAKQYPDALSCYRAVPLKQEVVKLQQARIDAMQEAITKNIQAIQADPRVAPDFAPATSKLRADMAQAQGLLANFQKVADYTPTLYLRMGRAFYELDKKWECIVAFGEVMRRYPTAPEAEPSLFEMVVAYVDLQRTAEAKKFGEQYLQNFPSGPNAGTVGYLMGAVAMNTGDLAGAEQVFTKLLDNPAASSYRQEILYMLGNCKFAQSEFDSATTTFKQYLSEFPSGTHAEDAAYHVAVATLFEGKPDDALEPLQDFLKSYPSGTYAADAKYRVGVCLSAQQKYDDVFKLVADWERDYPDNPEMAEVLALKADAFSATGKVDDAIAAYTQSYKLAKSPETLKYALFDGASKLLQKKGDWEGEAQLLEDFVTAQPDSQYATSAFFEIGHALVKEGKLEEARKFLATSVKKYMDDPDKDAVEKILSTLVQLCIKKARPPAADATPMAVPTPPPDPAVELNALLSGTDIKVNGTSKARVLYAKALLAGMQKHLAEQGQDFQAIADQSKPADLSAVILAQTADHLVEVGQYDKAAAFYAELEKRYPKSDQIDWARVGLGEIAYQKKDYATALRQFSDAVDKSTSALKLKDATLGKANTLLAMNSLDEAKKLFEQIASVREWRGPATAESLYSLGQIEEKQGKLPEAIAYYQRVFVAYQRYLPWVAKAYVASGEIFEKLGKLPEARNTYNEMLRNDKLSTFPETDEARQRLQALGNG